MSTLSLPRPRDRNRERLLNKMALFWAGTWLEQQTTAIPGAVIVQHIKQGGRPLAPGMPLWSIFRDFDNHLLILGEPGSGRTTTLLNLAHELVANARQDEQQPLPVLLNLPSWAADRKPLLDWVIDELYLCYQVPRSIGQVWAEGDQLVLLLDGLDEVKLEQREACIQALSQFRQQRGTVGLVVCSRTADHTSLSRRWQIQGALLLQPLTLSQISAHAVQIGDDFTLGLLKNDTLLQETLKSRLLLDLLGRVYPRLNEAVPLPRSVEAWRRWLIDAYIHDTFQEREPYSPEATQRWLAWLARQMVERAQPTFYIENLQPTWLENASEKRWYRLGVGIFGGLVGGLVLGLAVSLLTGRFGGGLAIGLYLGLGFWPALALVTGRLGKIHTVEPLNWSWNWPGLIVGGILGLLLAWVADEPLLVPVLAVAGALVVGLRPGLLIPERTQPNQAIWHTAHHALQTALVISLGFGLTVGVLGGLVVSPQVGLLVGLLFGPAVGLLGGLLAGGGLAVVKHAVLRLILWRKGVIPWNYARFLNYAVKRGWLCRIGSGYMFSHYWLMDYFAALVQPASMVSQPETQRRTDVAYRNP